LDGVIAGQKMLFPRSDWTIVPRATKLRSIADIRLLSKNNGTS
jgi:hypothetical protein